MLLPAEPTPLTYIVVGLLSPFLLPRFGCAVLAFLCDLDDYLENRKRR